MPKAPAPASAMRMGFMRSPGRGARRRCWTPARDRSDDEPLAAGPPPRRPWRPRDQPHNELDALAARLADVVDVRPLAAGLGVGNHLVEPGVVPDLVDEAGACALQLVAHAARAPDLHVQVFVKALDRAADGLPQLEAAAARRHGVLHDVDGERNDLEGPGAIGRLLAAEHGQRHREAVVHVHLVDDGEVEVFLDDRLRDVRGQLGVAPRPRARARAPAFIGRRVARPCRWRRWG